MPRTTQLRTYTIREGLLDEWAVKWRNLVVPLRLELGFEIGGAWVDHERSQFIWLISYEGDDTLEEANKRYEKRSDLIPRTTCLRGMSGR